ncbi:MAG TPA: hypothetical protein VK195_08280, partial [Burkholderiaceae bacterium]|nr:hypothetical protein [Burkholderiaceae bacterium]
MEALVIALSLLQSAWRHRRRLASRVLPALISLWAGFYGAAQAQAPCRVTEAGQRIELQACQVETRDAQGRRQLQAALLSDVSRTLHLDLGVPDAESIELELRQGAFLRTRRTLDASAPYADRPVASPRLQFELQLPSGPSELPAVSASSSRPWSSRKRR